jgi:molybdenum-dependent DNA-binding transcriptional regulator ModE
MQVRFNVWVEVEGEVALSLWRVALLEAVVKRLTREEQRTA